MRLGWVPELQGNSGGQADKIIRPRVVRAYRKEIMKKIESKEDRAEREGRESGEDRGRVNDNPYFFGSREWHSYEDGQEEGAKEREERSK